MNNFSPSLVLTALNLGDNSVPTTNAVNGIHKPIKWVYFSTKYLTDINNIAKHPSWYKKALSCNFVMLCSLSPKRGNPIREIGF